jgi:hypothetical protein
MVSEKIILLMKLPVHMKKLLLLTTLTAMVACTSTKNSIQNIDDKAIMPALAKDKTFIITEISDDKNYGYDQNYPINLGFLPFQSAEINVKRFLVVLPGQMAKGFIHKGRCVLPFPTKRYDMGAGLLDIYEVT